MSLLKRAVTACPYAATKQVPFLTIKDEVVFLDLCAFHDDIDRMEEE